MLTFLTGIASAGTLDDVRQKGFLQCGVNSDLAGFATPSDTGEWTGFEVDYCRAVAAAVFGDGTKVKFTPLSAKDRFPALQSGEIDVLIRYTSWTLGRDTQGFDFTAVNFYEGQSFLINKKKLSDISSALQLSGASVCVTSGTSTELNLADYFKRNSMDYNSVVFEKLEEVTTAYNSGRCDALTSGRSALYSIRHALSAPDDHVILPEIISKEPVAPLVRQGDSEWADIVRWTHNALLTAEELGITKANVDELKNSGNPEIKRVLGQEANTRLAAGLGLTTDWVVNIVKAVGNYGEIYDRNVGSGSKLNIPRGLNALWSKGDCSMLRRSADRRSGPNGLHHAESRFQSILQFRHRFW